MNNKRKLISYLSTFIVSVICLGVVYFGYLLVVLEYARAFLALILIVIIWIAITSLIVIAIVYLLINLYNAINDFMYYHLVLKPKPIPESQWKELP